MKVIAYGSAALAVAGCLPIEEVENAVQMAEFAATVSTAEDTFEAQDSLFDTEGFTPYATVANEMGAVSYTGYAVYLEEVDDGMTTSTTYLALGTFEATAAFGAAQEVTGTATDFFAVANPQLADTADPDVTQAEFGGALTGSFAFDMDIFDFEGNAGMNGTVNGTLTDGDGLMADWTDVMATGDFIGADIDGMVISGEVTAGDQTMSVLVRGMQ